MPKRKAAAVSMEPELFDRAKDRADGLGLSTFSAYVVQLIRKDLQERGELTLRETEAKYVAGASVKKAAKKRTSSQDQ